MEKKAYRDADYITSHTESSRRFLIERKGVPPDKISTVPNWLDIASFQKEVMGKFREKYGLKLTSTREQLSRMSNLSIVKNRLRVLYGLRVGFLDYFIDTLRESSHGFDFYLNKIFQEGKVNPCVFKLLLKFFPQELPRIYEQLQERHSDIDFMAKITRALGGVSLPLGLEILKHIFYSSNDLIKIEVLRSIPSLPQYDEFLLSALKDEDILIKKEALIIILERQGDIRGEAAAQLFSLSNPWGKNNKVILENIRKLASSGKDIIIRLPVVPGFNDDDANIEATGKFAASLGVVGRIDILPYNRGGLEKSALLAEDYELMESSRPSDERMDSIAERLRSFGFEVKAGG